MKTKKSRTKKWIWRGLLILLLALAGYLTYYQLWYSSQKLNSNIFKLERTLNGHSSEIWTVKFSPDGKWLASGSVDSTVKIWDKLSGAMVLNIKQPGGITYLAFSHDGNFLVTASYDEKVRLWKLPQGILLKEFSGHKGTVWSVDISADGKTIASAGEDAMVKLWDIETGRLLRTMTGHTRNIWNVKFSPDGASIASGSFDNSIKIWNAATGSLERTLTGHTEAVVSIAFSPDGKILASTSDDKTIKLWSTDDWRLLKTFTVPEHIQASDFSPDSKLLLTGGRDKPAVGEFLQNFFGDSKYNKGVSMRLWDVATGKLLQTFSQHANDVNDVSWCRDGKWIASASSDQTIELWKLTGH